MSLLRCFGPQSIRTRPPIFCFPLKIASKLPTIRAKDAVDVTEDKSAFQHRLWLGTRERTCSYQLMSNQPLQQLQQTSSITQFWEQIFHGRLPCLKHSRGKSFNIHLSSARSQDKTLTGGDITVSFRMSAVWYQLINWNYHISFDLWTVFGG